MGKCRQSVTYLYVNVGLKVVLYVIECRGTWLARKLIKFKTCQQLECNSCVSPWTPGTGHQRLGALNNDGEKLQCSSTISAAPATLDLLLLIHSMDTKMDYEK